MSIGRSNGHAGVVGNLAELGNDVTTLAELQAKLATIDMKEAVTSATVPVSLLALGAALGLAGLPLVLFGVAELLVQYAGMSRGWALVLVGLVTLALSGGLVVFGGLRLPRSFDSLRRSREELARNVAWIKTVLAHSGRFTPRKV